MSAILSSVPFPRMPATRDNAVRPEPAGANDAGDDDATEHEADALAAAAMLNAAEMPVPARAMAASGSPRTIAFAALAGALAAAVVVLAARQWLPPRPFDDPRLAQVAHQTGEFAEQLQGLVQKVRTLEVEGVAGVEAADALTAQAAKQHIELGALKTAVQRVADGYDNDTGGHRSGATAALFGVAVVQLRDAIDQGRPFDWELVDVRGIAGNDATLLRELYRLAPLASAGVPTAEQLRQGLQALSQAEAVRSAPTIVQTGLDIVGRAFGPTLVSAPANPNPALLQQASLTLERGDAGGTLRALRALTGDSAEVARPLAEAAERRAVALDATDALLSAARTRLQTQLRSATAASSVPGSAQ